jgi:N-acylglucosamine-6-phosphate 2-epimerase
MNHKSLFTALNKQLIVSCQAPEDSPLSNPCVITEIAKACVKRGARGLRLNTPEHIISVRHALPNIPIIGLWKQVFSDSSVYITPQLLHAEAVANAGADIIALDCTERIRPGGEHCGDIINTIKTKYGKLVMADIDSEESAAFAIREGADFIGTTLFGYTEKTIIHAHERMDFLGTLVERFDHPIICEGGISSPIEAKRAIDLGAFSIVIGRAITGIDLQTIAFNKALLD